VVVVIEGDIGVWWVSPKDVQERHLDRPIPSLYLSSEDFGEEDDATRKVALPDAFN
jgi:hypothetical protein